MASRARKSAVGTVLTCPLFADMALEEVDSKNMDHGKLSNETARELDMIVSQMRRFIHDVRAYLDRTEKSRTR